MHLYLSQPLSSEAGPTRCVTFSQSWPNICIHIICESSWEPHVQIFLMIPLKYMLHIDMKKNMKNSHLGTEHIVTSLVKTNMDRKSTRPSTSKSNNIAHLSRKFFKVRYLLIVHRHFVCKLFKLLTFPANC